RDRRLVAAYAGVGVVVGTALAWYNASLFGDVRGIYGQAFNGAFGQGLAGVLASPSHGLFVFSPVLLFALAGTWFWRRQAVGPVRLLAPLAALFSLSQVIVCARWPVWWGGDCYGPRLLTDILPCLILLTAGALDEVDRHRWARVAFAATAVFSVAVQMVGAFSFPLGFHTPEALWDWRQCPIVENARRGVTLAPYRVAGRFASDLLHGRAPDVQH